MRFSKKVPIAGACLLVGSIFFMSDIGAACDEYLGGGPVDPTTLFNELDLDHDGKVTHDEWVETEAPTPSWSAFMTKALVQKHGYVTLFDFLTDDAPGSIDSNCDGKVTLEEFLATKSMAPPGGGDAGGAGGPGGAPDGAAGGPPGGGDMQGGAPGGGGAQTTATHPSPTEPRDGLPEGSYSKTAPGQYPPYPDGGAADPVPMFNAIDANHDAKVTHEEWQQAGAPDDLWQALAEKPRIKANGVVTAYDLVMNPDEVQIDGIDTNEDGCISLDELLANKQWKSAAAEGPGGMGAPPQGGAPGAAAGGGGQGEGVYLKSDKMIAELDTNKDGCICKAEWTGAGLPEAIFGTLEGQAEQRDCVTDAELTKGAAPAGIDTNNDGYMEVEELKTYVAAHGTEPR
jgi:Ca2+-binding EF-hand superfamily protein